MTRQRFWMGALAALAILGPALAACPSPAAPPPQQPAAPPPPAPEPAPAPVPAAVAPDPIERGFTHCCGNERYRIEIDCGGMVKRCYSKESGSWRQTYGRHCLAALGQACYLEECDAKCQ